MGETRSVSGKEYAIAPGSVIPVRVAARRRVRGRIFIFPVLLNAWPVLLLISQKALVPLGLLFAGTGTASYRRDVALAALMSMAALVWFGLQRANEYAVPHLIGYVLFIAAVPLINLAVKSDSSRLLRLVAMFSVFNAFLAFVFFFLEIDLSGFRGLNRIIGEDEQAHRVYFESTSLVAVFAVSAFKRGWRRNLATLLVLAYAALLAKSVFVLALFAINNVLPRVLRRSWWQQLVVLLSLGAILIIGPIAVALLRPDVGLSIGIKLLQWESVLAHPGSIWSGSGWGYVIAEIVNSETQPYQIEMQLPMLFKQIGVVGVGLYAAGMWWFVRSASGSAAASWLRWSAYIAIGFNNPWLFMPSWYLTAVLLFRKIEPRR
jgi:hypothetical protein